MTQKRKITRYTPQKIYDSKAYSITKIPLNYQIKVKLPKTPTAKRNGIPRDFYSNLETGEEYAHVVAAEMIKCYFKK